MKRFHCMLLVFAALAFTAVGCVRTHEKRPPIEVTDANDYITPRGIDDTWEMFPKRARRDPPPSNETPDEKKQRVAAEEKKEAQDLLALQEKRANMLESIAKTYKSYFDPPRTAKKLTEEDFKLRLTRNGLSKIRKAYESQQFGLILEAHPEFADCIVAYWKDTEKGQQVAYINGTTAIIKGDVVPRREREQKVQAVFGYYKDYAAQNQQKSQAQFEAYLQANAQPAVANLVARGEIKVNIGAQIGNGAQVVACFGRADPALGANTTLQAVMGDRSFKQLTQAEVAAIFQQR